MTTPAGQDLLPTMQFGSLDDFINAKGRSDINPSPITIDINPSPVPSRRPTISTPRGTTGAAGPNPGGDVQAQAPGPSSLEASEKITTAAEDGPAGLSTGSSSSAIPPNFRPAGLDRNKAFWKAYNESGAAEDKSFVEAASDDLDAFLVFAGLFAATNTAFIVESYKLLKPDPVENSNKILISVFEAIRDPSQATLHTSPFIPSSRDIRINVYFLLSLCCSLLAAFGAVLAKQWVGQYGQDDGGTLKEPAARGRERHRKYQGRIEWHLEDVIAILPTLLQLSLFLFFGGLVDFFWPLSGFVTSLILVFGIATALFYITTFTISIHYANAPFQTRLSKSLRSPSDGTQTWWTRLWSNSPLKAMQTPHVPQNHPTALDTNLDCFSYLLRQFSKSEALEILADASVSLSIDLGQLKQKDERRDKSVAMIATLFVDLHLKPVSIDGFWRVEGLCGQEGLPLLKVLKFLGVTSQDLRWKQLHTCLNTINLLNDIAEELRRAFLINPKDSESCSYIMDNLRTMTLAFSTNNQMAEWEVAWLQKGVMTHLNNSNPTAQTNTLAILDVVTRNHAEQRRDMWGTIKSAAVKSPELKEFINSTVWNQISSAEPEGPPAGPGSPRLLDWMLVSYDMEGIADALEAVPYASGNGPTVVLKSIEAASGNLFKSYLKPTVKSWLGFTRPCEDGKRVRRQNMARKGGIPGLPGGSGVYKNTPGHRVAVLRIMHVLLVKWGCLTFEIELGTDPRRPATPLNATPMVSTLRGELMEIFLDTIEEPGVVRMAIDINKKLPIYYSASDNDNRAALWGAVIAKVSGRLRNSEDKPSVLKLCFSLLCSSADSLIAVGCFYDIHLTSRGSRTIADHLAATMGDGKTPDLDDFWTATFRVHLLPIFHPHELLNWKFDYYLHLWFERHVKRDAGISPGGQVPNPHIEKQTRVLWVYLLSLQRLINSVVAHKGLGGPNVYKHWSHLVGLLNQIYRYGSYPTWMPLAVHLLLTLQPGVTHKTPIVEKIRDAFRSEDFSVELMVEDIRRYNVLSRDAEVSDGEFCDYVLNQVKQSMDKMITPPAPTVPPNSQ